MSILAFGTSLVVVHVHFGFPHKDKSCGPVPNIALRSQKMSESVSAHATHTYKTLMPGCVGNCVPQFRACPMSAKVMHSCFCVLRPVPAIDSLHVAVTVAVGSFSRVSSLQQ
eukprot:6492654-Amphidinium_carterae.1